ncbi:MAG: MerR family DNA-binding transcriptional regulator [Actinomycetota bacterium]|nr:MerR family DNA-binding transcriptional regulator [Actinomycetota bacterium]
MDGARAGTEGRLLKVGEAARLTGLSVKTLHHYEERGLAEPATRIRSGACSTRPSRSSGRSTF